MTPINAAGELGLALRLLLANIHNNAYTSHRSGVTQTLYT
jgi:hypothetical protein